MVKNFFRKGSFEEEDVLDMYGSKPLNPMMLVNKKPILPDATEVKMNSRSRSAKLRVAEKISN
jgi:16S rRNA (cytosine1402-N4)-methyltransferase